jgi:hypothetical protein
VTEAVKLYLDQDVWVGLAAWYEAKLQNLHQQYMAGDLTLRGMARQLGLGYRELYDLMEAKGLTA